MQDYRILIVDDNLMARTLLAQHLPTMGFIRIAAVAGAALAIERMIQYHETLVPFHLVLLDWHMPGGDGDRFLVKCRADERFQSVPIIMVTAENQTKNILHALKTGATSYIVKPVSYADLKKSVTQALHRSEHKQ
jgi:DNA-binding response OmpR family regulator